MTSIARISYTVVIDQLGRKQALLSLPYQLNKNRKCYYKTESRYHIERFLQNLWIPGTRPWSCGNFIHGRHSKQTHLTLEDRYDKHHNVPFHGVSAAWANALHGWPQDLLLTFESPYFLGPTWPTFTRTQMTFLVCMPTEQEASPFQVVVVLKDDTEVSSMHGPQGPVCQWYTVQACSLQLRASCKALVFGQWAPPIKMDVSRWDMVLREALSSVSWN